MISLLVRRELRHGGEGTVDEVLKVQFGPVDHALARILVEHGQHVEESGVVPQLRRGRRHALRGRRAGGMFSGA